MLQGDITLRIGDQRVVLPDGVVLLMRGGVAENGVLVGLEVSGPDSRWPLPPAVVPCPVRLGGHEELRVFRGGLLQVTFVGFKGVGVDPRRKLRAWAARRAGLMLRRPPPSWRAFD